MNMDPAAVWWHVDDYHAPNLSKASLGSFCYEALILGIEIGQIWPLNNRFHRSWVGVTIKATITQKELLEAKTKFKFNPPPKLHLNC